jgi:hypothetical protein
MAAPVAIVSLCLPLGRVTTTFENCPNEPDRRLVKTILLSAGDHWEAVTSRRRVGPTMVRTRPVLRDTILISVPSPGAVGSKELNTSRRLLGDHEPI